MNFLNIYKGLPRSIYILFVAQVINRFGDFVVPFLTLFLVKKLGFSCQAAGTAVMAASLMTIPGAFAGGKISDHAGRKKTYAVFQLSAAFCLFLCAFTMNPMLIIPLIMVASFFNGGVRPVMSAMMTDVLTPEKRQTGFSLLYLGINIGVGVGSMVAGYLFKNYIQLTFIGSAVCTALAVLIVVSQTEESHPDHGGEELEVPEEEKAEKGHIFQVLARRPQILAFLILYVFFSVSYTQYSFSLPLMVEKIFGADGPQKYGFLMSFNAVTVLVMTVFVIKFMKEWNPLSAMIVGGATYAVGFGMIGMIHSYPMFLLSTYIWTLGEIIMVTNFGVYIANNSPQNFRARFSAVTSVSWAVGSALGTSGMGMYIDKMGVSKVWPFIFILCLMGMAGLYGLMIYGKTKQTQSELNEA